MLIKDFLDMVKVLRMLYGVNIAKEYFEKHINDFGDFTISDLFNYKTFDNVDTTTEK